MRWPLVLALACLAAGCRRGEPPARPGALATAQPTPAPASTAAVPATGNAPAAGTAARPAPAGEALPVIQLPAPIYFTNPEPKKPEDEHDDRLYSWTDEAGGIHYGTADDIPDSRRATARVVSAGVTTVPNLPDAPGSASADSAPTPPPEDGPPTDPSGRGPEPRRDAQGLPIPGTMDDTAATRAANAAGEKQLDPAAVQRRHEEELRRMNCKQKDGVWYCG